MDRRTPFTFVPRWQQFILQSQIVIVYFFAGVVKVKWDWLVLREPMTSLCRVHERSSPRGPSANSCMLVPIGQPPKVTWG